MSGEIRIVQALVISIGVLLIVVPHGSRIVAWIQALFRGAGERGSTAKPTTAATRKAAMEATRKVARTRRTSRPKVAKASTIDQVNACLEAFESTSMPLPSPTVDEPVRAKTPAKAKQPAKAETPAKPEEPAAIPASFQALSAQLKSVKAHRAQRKESPSQALRRLHANDKLSMIRLQARLDQRCETRPEEPVAVSTPTRAPGGGRVRAARGPAAPQVLSPRRSATRTTRRSPALARSAAFSEATKATRAAPRPFARPSLATRSRVSAPAELKLAPTGAAERAQALAEGLLSLAQELRQAGDPQEGLAATVSEALGDLQRAFLVLPCAGEDLWKRLERLAAERVSSLATESGDRQ